MKVAGKAWAVVGLIAMSLVWPSRAHGGLQPRWTDAELVGFADVILAGRIVQVRAGTDPVRNDIYTYVTVDIARVLKGTIGSSQVIVKQLGGRIGARGLRVHGQATFVEGEDALLFLQIRPRDRTLYTLGGWQGKRVLDRGAVGARLLERVADVLQRTRRARDAPGVNTHPADAAAAVAQPFVLFDPPIRFSHLPYVDVQTGGQPGLPGGGFVEVFGAMSRWNSAGSAFAFQPGSANGPARCYQDELGNGRVTISFNDPCGEIADAGGTLALGGAYYDTSRGAWVNGVFYYEATEGFVVNNDGSVALAFLRNNNCFSDIQLHELGHVLGLDHSNLPSAVMYPTISGSCAAAARELGADDILGVRAIYPVSSVTPPVTAPANLTATVNGTSSVMISFSPVVTDTRFAGSAASSYRLDFSRSPAGSAEYSVSTPFTTVEIAIPAGLGGTFYVSVAGVNVAGQGPSSPKVAFTVACAAPAAPIGLSGALVDGVASAWWQPSATATHYVVQAGSAIGAADYGTADVGRLTGVSVPGLPFGFRAFVRVFAVNACGPSAPTNDLLIQ